MQVHERSVITMSYQLHVIEGVGTDQEHLELIEERTPENPLDFVFGTGHVLPAIEHLLLGQTPGFLKVVRLESAHTFGPYRKELAQWVPRQQLPKKMDLKIGMKFQTQGPDGDVMAVILKDIKDDKVLLDGNHPLAGATLQFDLRLMRVREATPDELRSGQVQKLYH